jgi:hypothetical protein
MVASRSLLRSALTVLVLGPVLGSAGCGALLKDEDKGGGGACDKKAVPAVQGDCTVAQTHGCDETQQVPNGGGATDGAGAGGDEENDADEAKATDLPFNSDGEAALTAFLLDVAASEPAAGASMPPPADPVPGPESPGLPFPANECRSSEATTTVVPNPGEPPYGFPPNDDGCYGLIPAAADDGADDGSAGAAEEMKPGPTATGGRCPADATQTKNVKLTGTDEASSLEWKALDGLHYYQDGVEACTDLGDGWHMADARELDTLLQVQGFRVEGETTGCVTSFWAAGATESGAQCTAGYRGFRWMANDPSSTLPINTEVVARNESGSASVYDKQSILCVRGRLKPTEQCSVAVAALFAQKPLGITDPATGKTWAKITIRSFDTVAGVEEQCAKGAAERWRAPKKGELEQAIQSDIFKTVAYEGADLTCPKVWYLPSDDTGGTNTCAGLGVSKDGEVTFLADEQCVPTASTGGAANDSVAFMPQAGSSGVYGLCVQDPP